VVEHLEGNLADVDAPAHGGPRLRAAYPRARWSAPAQASPVVICRHPDDALELPVDVEAHGDRVRVQPAAGRVPPARRGTADVRSLQVVDVAVRGLTEVPVCRVVPV